MNEGTFEGVMYFWACSMSGDMTSTNLSGYHFQAVVTSESAARAIEKIYAGGGWLRYAISYRVTLYSNGGDYTEITAINEDEPHLDMATDSLRMFDIHTMTVLMRDMPQIKDYITAAVRQYGDNITQDIGTGNLPYTQ